MKKTIVFLSFFILLSCDIPYIENEYNPGKKSSFNYLGKQLKEHYVYMELKGIDIDLLNKTYGNKVSNSMGDEEFFNLLSEYMNEFKDGHANIRAPFAISSAYSIILGTASNSFNPNYDSLLIKNHYLNENPVYGYTLKNGLISRGSELYGYIRYSSFMDAITTYEIEYILKRFEEKNVKGIILDIRGNGGGSLLNSNILISYFGYDPTDSEKEILKVWRRDGIDTYTKIDQLTMFPFIEVPFTVSASNNVYKGKVALLTNRGSYSASSFTSTAFKVFDNVKQIGDNTGGGMGLPIGGTMPNGWRYRFSSNIVMDVIASDYKESKYNYENGVPADILVMDDPDTDNSDEIIDTAISWINGTYNP